MKRAPHRGIVVHNQYGALTSHRKRLTKTDSLLPPENCRPPLDQSSQEPVPNLDTDEKSIFASALKSPVSAVTYEGEYKVASVKNV